MILKAAVLQNTAAFLCLVGSAKVDYQFISSFSYQHEIFIVFIIICW
tara:strand:- start:293 stop:433 length:141 start_codon:yes stop_codon:yes gene_type:complete